MTNTNRTTTRRRQRRHEPTSLESLDAMPNRQPVHVPLDRCPGLPGIQMNGAHVFRHDEDGETLCTRCDLPLPHGLCLACGQTLYVSKAWGDLRDASSGEARCTGRLMRADAQPSHPYTDTAHVLRADDPLLDALPKPTTGKAPSPPAREMRPGGLVCTTCRKFVVVGEGHAPDCSYKARSIAYNAELHERLLRADALAAAERERRDARNAERRERDGDDGESTPRRRRSSGPRAGGGGIPDEELCEGSGDAVVGPIEQRKFVRAARCTVCERSVPVSPQDTYRRHRPGKGGTPRSPRVPVPGVDVPDESVPGDDVPVEATPPKKRTPKKATPARTKTTTPKATPKQPSPNEVAAMAKRPRRTTKKHGRSALSAKAVVHAMKGATPACGASIATITRTSDPVTCRTCAAQLAAPMDR